MDTSQKIINCQCFAQSAGPGSEKGPLLELIFDWLRKGLTFGAHFRTRGALLCNFWLIFRALGALWQRWGPIFLITKTVWTTKGAPRGISRDIYSLFWSHFGVIFEYFLIFEALFFSFVFCSVPGPISHGLWLHFDTFF